MLKKSLISAALIALSSVSAWADSESSFYLGAKGLYFMPKDEISADSQNELKKRGPNLKWTQSGGIFLPGLQFGYNVSDSIRVGLAGYFGASKFKYTTDNFYVINRRYTHAYSDLKVELGPRFVALATMDMKIFESDSFALGFGIGAGAAKWKSTTSFKKNDKAENFDYSKWKPAFMGTVNADLAIGDVAVLTGSIGYAHLGIPKGLESSHNKSRATDADANKAKGFVFGIGIGKEF